MTTYIFHRGDRFYLIELFDDKAAIESIMANPGTTKIERVNKDMSKTTLFPH